MAKEERWLFTEEQLDNSPSRLCGFDAAKELLHRQDAASLIQAMGKYLRVNQLCINTAIVYMHRFYVFHSFTLFHRKTIATAALFLAAKAEEQAKLLKEIIKVSQACLMKNLQPLLDERSEEYLQQVANLIMNESVLLQTLGFDVAIEHPHTHIVRCCALIRANKDLTQTAYFMATNSLHLTTMCLRYKPTIVACFCIHLACKWNNWEVPQSNEDKPWYAYVDEIVTLQMLEELTAEFLSIFDKCPSRLKKRIYQQNSQNSLSSQNFFIDMDASSRNLFDTSCDVSFQQPAGLMNQPQSELLCSSDADTKQEFPSSANLRHSCNQPASTWHKLLVDSAPKTSQEALQLPHLPPTLSKCLNSLAPVTSNGEPEIQKMNLVRSPKEDQYGGIKRMNLTAQPLFVCGDLRSEMLPHAPEHEVKEIIKKDAVVCNDLNANISMKKDLNSNDCYQKSDPNLSLSSTLSSDAMSSEVTSLNFSQFSLSQNSALSPLETVSRTQEKPSPVQKPTQMDSISSLKLRSPPVNYESLLEHTVRTELSNDDNTYNLLASLPPLISVTSSMPTSRTEMPEVTVSKLAPVAPRLGSMTELKSTADESKISVNSSSSSNITAYSIAAKCVLSNNYTPNYLPPSVELRSDDVIVHDGLSAGTTNTLKQQFQTELARNNSGSLLSASCGIHHDEKKKSSKNEGRSLLGELLSEQKMDGKNHVDQEKDKASVSKRRIISDLASLKISIPMARLKGILSNGSLNLKSSLSNDQPKESDQERDKDCDKYRGRKREVNYDPNSLKIKMSKQALPQDNAASRKRDRNSDDNGTSLSLAPFPKKCLLK